jgi:hypothetical protein
MFESKVSIKLKSSNVQINGQYETEIKATQRNASKHNTRQYDGQGKTRSDPDPDPDPNP